MLLRSLLFAALAILIYFGVRRIWRDWSGKFNADAEEAKRLARARDLADRQTHDVRELIRDQRSRLRPGDRDGNDKRH